MVADIWFQCWENGGQEEMWQSLQTHISAASDVPCGHVVPRGFGFLREDSPNSGSYIKVSDLLCCELIKFCQLP